MNAIRLGLRLLLGWMLVLGSLGVRTPQPAASQAGAPPAPMGTELLQFQAGGHLMGFAADRVYWVAVDHALSATFLGTPGVTPQSAGSAGSRKGAAAPLEPVTYQELWPGVELVYTAADRGIAKATYTVAPGADPGQIRLRYNVPVAVQSDGSLAFAWERGRMTESAPVAWQTIAGRRVPVAVAFAVSREQEVAFTVGAYDPRYPLVIDPTYGWHTFYNMYLDEDGPLQFYDIALDSASNVYLVASSNASWLGDGNTPPIHPHSKSTGDCPHLGSYNCLDLLVVKLNSAGIYQWHTFYGAAGVPDYGFGIAVNDSGSLYVTGFSGFWLGDGETEPIHSTSGGIVVLKLNTEGAYQWHTFYPDLIPESVALDSAGNIYVAGAANSGWLGDNETPPLHPYTGAGDYDLAMLKLDSAGAYQWHTFYGAGSLDDIVYKIEIDGGGNLYAVGNSASSWLGDNDTPPLHSSDGGNLFILKVNSAGGYQWHTFYRVDSGFSNPPGMTLDGADGVVVVGHSNAEVLGDPGGAPLHETGELLILKLNSEGGYQWHTFYRGQATDVAADAAGNLYLLGTEGIDSAWDPEGWSDGATADPWHPLSSARGDVLIMKLGYDGSYRWRTFYGGTSRDSGHALAVGADDALYAVGVSYGAPAWLGDNDAEPIHPYGDYNIALFALKLENPPVSTTFLKSSANPARLEEPVTFTARVATEAGQPTGTLTFTIAGHSEVTRTLDAQGVATYSVAGFGPGAYTVTAQYGGNGWVQNHATTLVEVVKRDAAIQLAKNRTASVVGQRVVFTATVTAVDPGGPVPTGTVRFSNPSSNRTVDVSLNISGNAVYTVPFWQPDTEYTMTAEYLGGVYYLGGSRAVLTHSVTGPAETTIALIQSEPTTSYKGEVSFSAIVRGTAPESEPPRGRVVFSWPGGGDEVELSSSGWAQTTTALLPMGVSTITARFISNELYQESESSATHTVVRATPRIELRHLNIQVVYGQEEIYTATVSPVPPVTETPGGVVTFMVSGQALATLPIEADGTVTWTFGGLEYPPVGYHGVWAVYGGDGIFSDTLTGLTQVVAPAQTRVQLEGASGTASAGHPVVLTATVTAVAPGRGVPTGTVTFLVAGRPAVSVPLGANGWVTYSPGVLPAGTHPVTVQYGGVLNYSASSIDKVLTVNRAESTVQLIRSSEPERWWQAVVFTATVQSAEPGSLTPTGRVTWTVAGQAPVPGWLNASGVMTGLVVLGQDVTTVTVEYGGDDNFLESRTHVTLILPAYRIYLPLVVRSAEGDLPEKLDLKAEVLLRSDI